MKELTMMSESELLNLLDEWRGAGAYSITGDIIRELRKRRAKKMGTKNKKASNEAEINSINNIIISGKTYRVNELDCIFSFSALMNATKEELYQYWQMAIETGIKRYRDIVDYVFNKRFPRYE